jgi:hypothetical protein
VIRRKVAVALCWGFTVACIALLTVAFPFAYIRTVMEEGRAPVRVSPREVDSIRAVVGTPLTDGVVNGKPDGPRGRIGTFVPFLTGLPRLALRHPLFCGYLLIALIVVYLLVCLVDCKTHCWRGSDEFV